MPRMRRLIAVLAASISICAQDTQPAAPAREAAPTPRIVLSKDDTEITESCIIEIPTGYIIADANTNGVIRIGADDIRVRFVGELRGATNGTPWDTLRGIGIRIDNHKNVTIENAKIRGFKNGILATLADGLMITDCDFADNYRQHLKSTREAESNDDWLFPHHNDKRKWHDEYGGAICIESATNVVVRRVQVRRGQNGILLDRVTESSFYDNDCSFLSGWGIALWMSSGNKITRNAFDFCVRGHVEDVYNRGQDSAGILCFEQSGENLFAENSATHGGDGFFGFAGHNAIGESWWNGERARLRQQTGKGDVEALIKPTPELERVLSDRGCNGNILIANDFSYASAHGIELTFSEDNVIAKNRIVENGICGFWGGYSSRTLIIENDFERNGAMGYSLERGAINMEHAADNLIIKNDFVNNKCAIHLWWDDDGQLMKYPGVAGNNRGVIGNIIMKNTFEMNRSADFKRMAPNDRFVMLQIRDSSKSHVRDNHYFDNTVKLKHPLAVEFALADETEISLEGEVPKYEIPKYEALGIKRPVGARRLLRDRRYISIDEWGPKEY
jgi:parallel beta-helix repeat protein